MGLPWRYAIGCVDDLGLILRAEVIWSKPNGLPESVTDRVRRSHEHWFHFTKSPRYFSAVDEIREQHLNGGRDVSLEERRADPDMALAMHRNLASRNGGGGKFVTFAGNPLGKLPGSVWTIPTEPLQVPDELGVDHFAAFPTEWPRRLILGWSPADGVVLDPFCGTGTTVAVAKALGRDGIGVDLSTDYLRLADWRCNGDGYRRIQSKVLGTKPDKVSQYDVPLFDVEAL
jgi:site-specific DNA-methyltransferase (cytosine-N4-specific)